MKPSFAAPSSGAAPVDQDGLPTPRRYWAILTICLGVTMAVLDGAIANVALPTIAHDLGAAPAEAIWVINAYQLAIIVALLPLAALGDKLGYRRVYIAGLAVFTAASLACAMAHDLAFLTAARVVQGLGAAAIMSITPALIRFAYPQRLLGRGIGINAVIVSMAAAIGPTVASAILATSGWPWLFAINVPLGLIAVLVAWQALLRKPGSGARFDSAAALLNLVAFGGLILGIDGMVRSPNLAWGLTLAAGLAAGVLLVQRERKQATPMLPVDLLRIRPLRLSIMTSVVCFSAQMLAFVAIPFHFQQQLGLSAVKVGLLMTPWPIAVMIAAPVAGRLADRYAAGLLGGIGLAIFAAGLALLALLPAHPGNPHIIVAMALCGIGFGLFQSPNNRTIVSSAPRPRSGAAGGLLATARLLGQTSGAVAMAMLFHLAPAHATTTALWIAAAIAVVAAGVSLLRLRPTPQAS